MIAQINGKSYIKIVPQIMIKSNDKFTNTKRNPKKITEVHISDIKHCKNEYGLKK